MKPIYMYDNNKIFISSDLIADDAELPKNATFSQPTDGLRDPIKWNGNEWLGATQEEHDEYHKNDPVEPGSDGVSSQDKVNAMLIKQGIDFAKRLKELEGGQ